MTNWSSRSHRLPGGAWVYLASAALVIAALWLPFGFALTALIEEWDLLGMFQQHGVFFYTHLDGPVAAHALRPLMPLSFALAHLLAPDSFNGWHVLMISALLGKAWALGDLAACATDSRRCGVFSAALVLLYPADTMQLSFRSIHINVALACALVGCALWVRAWDARTRSGAWILAGTSALLLLGAVLIYEVALTLILLPLAICFVVARRVGVPVAGRLPLLAAWSLPVLLYGGYLAWVFPRIATYQGGVTGSSNGLLKRALEVFPQWFEVGGARALLGGWIDAVGIVTTAFQSRSYLWVASAVVCLLVLAVGGRGSARGSRVGPDARAPLRLFLVALVLMMLGYAPFLASPPHMAISQRTFLWATPGAVLAWVAALWWLAGRARVVAGAMGGALLFFGLGAQLYQFHQYVELAQQQRRVLRSIVESFEAATPDQRLLVIDRTAQIGHTWMFADQSLQFALGYLLDRPIGPFEVCRWPSFEWQRVDSLGRKGSCVEQASRWTFAFPTAVSGPGVPLVASKPARSLQKDGLVRADIDEQGHAVGRPEAAPWRAHLAAGDDAASRRYRGILAVEARPWIGPMFRDQFPSSEYRYSFGDWWSIESPPRGAGWREAEWRRDGLFKHRSTAWKMSPSAELFFDIRPVAQAYVMRLRFDQFANPTDRDLRLSLNGVEVPFRWLGDLALEAYVAPHLLTAGRNRFELQSPLAPDYFGLSLRVDEILITPVPPAVAAR